MPSRTRSAANLALAMLHTASSPKRVGLLDLDIFGPSVPKLMGLEAAGEPDLTKGSIHPISLDVALTRFSFIPDNHLIPLNNHGISCMSMAFLLPPSTQGDTPVVWRGMMVMKAVQQLLFDVDWRERRGTGNDLAGGRDLDLLVIDLPPGTGDVQLSLGQLVECDGTDVPMLDWKMLNFPAGSVIVSTPQDVALIDVRKGAAMFRKIGIPVSNQVYELVFCLTRCADTWIGPQYVALCLSQL